MLVAAGGLRVSFTRLCRRHAGEIALACAANYSLFNVCYFEQTFWSATDSRGELTIIKHVQMEFSLAILDCFT